MSKFEAKGYNEGDSLTAEWGGFDNGLLVVKGVDTFAHLGDKDPTTFWVNLTRQDAVRLAEYILSEVGSPAQTIEPAPVTRDEFDALVARVAALEPKPVPEAEPFTSQARYDIGDVASFEGQNYIYRGGSYFGRCSPGVDDATKGPVEHNVGYCRWEPA